MKQLYFDNASTSFPKAPGVGEAMARYINEIGVSVGRGSYPAAVAAEELVLDLREAMAAYVGADDPAQVIFTGGATASLNMLLLGLLSSGDHVLISPLEHNAVMRPLAALEASGVTYSVVPLTPEGDLALEALPGLVTPRTKALCMTHASNVTGQVLSIGQACAAAKQLGLYTLVDSAQTLGHLPISMADMQIDGLAFTGHKGLLGPQGIGGMILSADLAHVLRPTVYGGTGSRSHSLEMPVQLPDRLEPGTPNLPGMAGLAAGLEYCRSRREGVSLLPRLAQGLAGLDCGTVLHDPLYRIPVVSVDFTGLDNGEVSHRLAVQYGIATRSGLHCAPMAHRTLGTFPRGTVRFALSPMQGEADVEQCLYAVKELVGEMRRYGL